MNKQNLPIQSAPVTRYVSPGAASGGVEACGIWDDIKSVGKAALPIVGTVAKALL